MEYLLDAIEKAMDSTIKMLEGVSEEKADKVPTSFPDNIRWNTGHAYFLNETVAFKLAGHEEILPEGFATTYGKNGASIDKALNPENFKQPTVAELIELIKNQKERLSKTYAGKVHDDFAEPIVLPWGATFSNTEQLLLMLFSHWSFHNGILTRYLSILQD